MKLKPGMKVRVRQWDDMEEEYELDEKGYIDVLFVFTDEMRKFCGEVFTISDIYGYEICLREKETKRYYWSEEMFELSEENICYWLGKEGEL